MSLRVLTYHHTFSRRLTASVNPYLSTTSVDIKRLALGRNHLDAVPVGVPVSNTVATCHFTSEARHLSLLAPHVLRIFAVTGDPDQEPSGATLWCCQWGIGWEAAGYASHPSSWVRRNSNKTNRYVVGGGPGAPGVRGQLTACHWGSNPVRWGRKQYNSREALPNGWGVDAARRSHATHRDDYRQGPDSRGPAR